MLEDPRRRGEAQNIVDDRRLAKQTRDCGQRRLDANLAALPLQAIDSDVSSPQILAPAPSFASRSNARPKPSTLGPRNPAGPRALDGARKDREGMRIFRSDVDVAFCCADRDRGDGHALDQKKRVPLHQHPVGEGPAVALVGVADHVFLLGGDPGRRPPFDARGKAGPAPTTQARAQDLLDGRLGPKVQRALEAPQPAMIAVFIDRQGIGQPAAGKNKPLLPGQIRHIVYAPERLGMRAAAQKPRIEQLRNLISRDRSIADSPGGGFGFDQRLEPKEAARPGADNRCVETAAARIIENRVSDRVSADRQRRRIARNEDACGHCVFR